MGAFVAGGEGGIVGEATEEVFKGDQAREGDLGGLDLLDDEGLIGLRGGDDALLGVESFFHDGETVLLGVGVENAASNENERLNDEREPLLEPIHRRASVEWSEALAERNGAGAIA